VSDELYELVERLLTISCDGQTVLEAVREYPMASFWAFVMSCTIVSLPPASSRDEYSRLILPDHGILRRLSHR
jgi:hypothetical protein